MVSVPDTQLLEVAVATGGMVLMGLTGTVPLTMGVCVTEGVAVAGAREPAMGGVGASLGGGEVAATVAGVLTGRNSCPPPL